MQQFTENKKLMVFIQANCQSHALRNIFQKVDRLHSKYEIMDVKPVHLWKDEDRDSIFSKIKECDIFLHQPIFEQHFGKFASDNLKKHLKDSAISVSFPNLYFTGYHPQAFYLKDDTGKNIFEPFDYHDRNIVEFFKQGLNAKKMVEKIQDESFYSQEEIKENIELSLKDLENREKFTSIKMSPIIRNQMKGKKLFHIFNHPTNEMIFILMNKILDRLGDDLLVYNEMQQFPNEMLGQIQFPVYKSVQKYFDIEEQIKLVFWKKEYLLEKIINEYYIFYSFINKLHEDNMRYKKNNIIVYGINYLKLEIFVENKIKFIKINLDKYNFLHLSFIYLRINNRWSKINKNMVIDAQQSSLHKNDEQYSIKNLIDNKCSFFSTKNENKPWVIIEFDKEYYVEKIGLVNRGDNLWERANSINVSTSKDAFIYNNLFDAESELSRNNMIIQEIEKLKFPVTTEWKIKLIKKQLYNLKKSIKLDNTILAKKYLNQLVETFSLVLKKDFELFLIYIDFCREVFRNILFPILGCTNQMILLLLGIAIIDNKNKEAFLIYRYCTKDCSVDERSSVDRFLIKIGKSIHGYPLIVGAHNIVRPLRTWPQKLLLNTLSKIQNACDIDEVIDLFVCYGTLLGIYRDGNFIEYDDDMDMLIILENKINVDDVANKLVKELEKKELKVHVAKTNKEKIPFIQVFDKDHKVWTDIFIGFIEKDEVSLPMQNVNYYNIPKNLLFPCQQFEFGGFSLNVPNNIPEFLEYRYGKNWEIPDRYFRNSE